MQSLRQPSLDFSPASSPLSSSGEVSAIPDTPPTSAQSAARKLLPLFSSARERERGSSLSAQYNILANQLPAWCANGGSRSNRATPSSRQSESPGSSASSSVSSADNCK